MSHRTGLMDVRNQINAWLVDDYKPTVSDLRTLVYYIEWLLNQDK